MFRNAVTQLRQLWELSWPASHREDSETLRRNKLGVRGLNGVLIGMIGVMFLVLAREFAVRELWGKLLVTSLGIAAYLIWALLGVIPFTSSVLRPGDAVKTSPWPLPAWPRTWAFFAVELGIAAFIVKTALPVNPSGVLRIVLLPILAHAAIFLHWRGIAIVAVLSAGLYGTLLSQPVAGGGPVGFLIEGTFTFVCMNLVVSTLKGRKAMERLTAELAAANRELGAYAAQAEELAAARERNRLAREIHDSVGHYLTVVHVQLEAALATHHRGAGLALDAIQKAQSLAGEGLRDIRSSIAALRAAPLESRTLCEALLALVAECESAGLNVKIDVRGAERELSAGAGLTLYRAAQEGLTNVRKHAGGAGARLFVDFRPANSVTLTVSDDGPGADSTDRGFGLIGLRERAALLGGKFSTRTSPGEGFSLTLELPE